jgi:hypothetical protein
VDNRLKLRKEDIFECFFYYYISSMFNSQTILNLFLREYITFATGLEGGGGARSEAYTARGQSPEAVVMGALGAT